MKYICLDSCVVCAQHRHFICALSWLFQLAEERPAPKPAATHWDVIPSHFPCVFWGHTVLDPQAEPPRDLLLKKHGALLHCCVKKPVPLPSAWRLK